MSSWRTWDTDDGWDGLDQVDNGLLTAVKQVYHSILQFDGAFEDQKGAEDTVRELLAGNRASRDLARISASLWEWKQRRCRRPAAAKRLASSLDVLPGKFPRGGVSSASVFEDLVAGSVVLGIAQLEKALRARKGIIQRREEQEAALRERWAWELAGLYTMRSCPAISYGLQWPKDSGQILRYLKSAMQRHRWESLF